MNLSNTPSIPDLQDENHSSLLTKKADAYLRDYPSIAAVKKLEEELSDENNSIFDQLAAKLAVSKSIIQSLDDDAFISVVFAIYKEVNRMKKREDHPHGEDLILRKIEQLEWLTEGTSLSWEMVIVDDGCPDGSGQLAQEILTTEAPDKDVKVLFLEDAIENELSVVSGLKNTKDSRKGGSVLFGMWYAVQRKRENHVIFFTDADLSTHLGQSGLLLEPILLESKSICIGSRREPSSVVIKGGSRSDRGRLFIHLWKLMVPILEEIIDTQCGFKAFKAEVVESLVLGNLERKFAFDIELLIKIKKATGEKISKRGIAWIDSEEASTTKDLQPYLDMLKSIGEMSKYYLQTIDIENDDVIDYISNLEETEWNSLLNKIPIEIVNSPIENLGNQGLVKSNMFK